MNLAKDMKICGLDQLQNLSKMHQHQQHLPEYFILAWCIDCDEGSVVWANSTPAKQRRCTDVAVSYFRSVDPAS
jgi:hypothetical protein